MKPLERVLAALSHTEPDYVPVFMLMNLHGAAHHGVSIEDYYKNPKLVAEAQLHFQKTLGNDVVHNFHYAGAEIEAFGGSVVFRNDGPPNAGAPFIEDYKQIDTLKVPDLSACPQIQNILEVTRLLAKDVSGEVLIVGVVMSPYSLPVMQLGFEKYLILKNTDKARFEKLMDINKQFCVEFANKQLEAGCNAIVYFDPVSSSTVSTRKEFEEMGKPMMIDVVHKINGPVAVHYASGLVLPVIDDVIAAGAAVIGTSSKEDHDKIKVKAKGKITILGNLNGVEMVRWTKEDCEKNVKDIIRKAGPGGGFVLCDNHGEIPLQVPLETIKNIIEAARKWGKYPLTWIHEEY